jgi:WD40 repeat protein
LLALAVGGLQEKMIRIRRRDNAQEVRVLDLATALPLDIHWTAQGNRFFVPCSDKTVKVYQGGSWNQLATWSGHDDWVYRVALNSDGSKLASASADGTIKLWNAADGKLLATGLQLTPRTDEWLLVTPQGYLATSVPTALRWKTTNIKTPPDKLTSLFHRPELVRDAIAGNKVAPPPVVP